MRREAERRLGDSVPAGIAEAARRNRDVVQRRRGILKVVEGSQREACPLVEQVPLRAAQARLLFARPGRLVPRNPLDLRARAELRMLQLLNFFSAALSHLHNARDT